MRKNVVTALFVFVIVFLSIAKVEAMPEAVSRLAYDYYLYKVENPESDNPAPNLFEYFRRDLDSAYAGEGAEGVYDPNIYNDTVVSMKKAISTMRNRNTYSQERAVNELGRMIDSGNFPANYIFAKGQYKYTSDINAVLVKTNLRLRSQPNTQAKILKTLRSRRDWDGGPDICNYMGEWTNPQGERWVLVSYDDYEKGKLIGWLSGKYTQFITDAQIMEVANAFEKALAAPRRTARNEHGRQEETYTANSQSQYSNSLIETARNSHYPEWPPSVGYLPVGKQLEKVFSDTSWNVENDAAKETVVVFRGTGRYDGRRARYKVNFKKNTGIVAIYVNDKIIYSEYADLMGDMWTAFNPGSGGKQVLKAFLDEIYRYD